MSKGLRVCAAIYFAPVTLTECVRWWLNSTGRKQNVVAGRGGLKESQISEILSDDPPDPRFSTVEKFAAGFGVSVGEFFSAPRPERDIGHASTDSGESSGARIEDRLGELFAHIGTLKGKARSEFILALVAILSALEHTGSSEGTGTTTDDGH